MDLDPNMYVISLDAIDLNLLPSIYRTRDDRVEPLWAKSNLDRRQNEYYQFQIKSTDEEKVKESSKHELENMICHICDIEVPKPFLIEHRKSSRHKTNLKISNIAVNRMKKHMNSTDNENCLDIIEIDSSVYFCTICVMVMDCKEKETHNKSLSHKNSIVFEKILHEFLNLYDSHTNDNEENDFATNFCKGSNLYTNVCKQNDSTTKEKKENNFYSIENKENDFYTIENEGNDCGTNVSKGNNLNTNVSKQHHNTTDKEKKGNNFYINENKENDFYSAENKGNGFYSNESKGSECYTNKRNKNDGHTSGFDENERKADMNMNINDSLSSTISQKPVITSKKDISLKESMAKRVSVNDYLNLLNRRKDGLMSFKLSTDSDAIEIETLDGSVVKVAEDNFHSFNRVGKKHMQCFVCKEIFKGNAVEAHKMSEKHIKLMVAPLRDKHCARQIDDRLSHCLICNAVTKELDYHALCDDEHCEYLKAALVSDKLNDDYDQYAAKECLKIKELNVDSSNMVSHDNSNNENIKENDNWIEVSKNNRKADAEVKNNVTETNVIPTKYFCVSCNRFVYYSLKHNESANHIWNLKSDYHYLMKLKEDEVSCQVCNVPVTDDPDDFSIIKNHVFGKEHFEKFNELLVDNKMEKFKSHFYCRPCNKVILIKNELKHMGEKRHKRCSAVKCNSEVTGQHEIDKITEKNDDNKSETNENQNEKMLLEDYICDICDVKVPNCERNIQEHMDGRSHAANVQKKPQVTFDQDEITNVHYQMELTKFPNVLNCLMCKVYILHNELSVSEHLNHTHHKINYKCFLKGNNLVLRDDDCYCNTCKVFVGIKNEILHVFGKKHAQKQKLELASLIESKNSKGRDIRNLQSHVFNNIEMQNIATPSESINDEQNIATPSVSNNEDKQNIATPSVSSNENKKNIDTPSVSTNEDEQNIATPSVSSNEDKQNIVTPFMSNLHADTFPPYIFDENFPMLKDLYRNSAGLNVVSVIKKYNEQRTNPDTLSVRDNSPCNDSYATKVINDGDPNMVKNINIPSVSNIKKVNASSLTSKSDVLVLGKNPGLPGTMRELLEPTAHPKVVICKICRVEVPYNKMNVSGHMNGSKHKNARKKILEGNVKLQASSVQAVPLRLSPGCSLAE